MNSILKVFIIGDSNEHVELIKDEVLKFSSKCLFITAHTKNSFTKKINWFNPNVLILDNNLKNTGYKKVDLVKKLKNKLPNSILLFINRELDINFDSVENSLKSADGYLLKEDFHNLPNILEDLVEKKSEQIATGEFYMLVLDMNNDYCNN